MDLSRWILSGYASRFVPGGYMALNYYLESAVDNTGRIHYRARNISTDAIVPLSGNNGQSIAELVEYSSDPEQKLSASAYPMKGYPYVLSSETPGWFNVVILKNH